MLLSADVTIKSVTSKKTKDNKEYLDVVVFQELGKYNNHVFVFGKKLDKFKNSLKENTTCVLMYNYFWSAKSKKEVMVLQDVIPC